MSCVGLVLLWDIFISCLCSTSTLIDTAHRLLINYPTSAGWLQESQNSDPCFCFHEILVSYRILFDSPISSWARWTRIGRSQPTIPPTSDAAITSDPLLNLLCSSPPNSPQRQRIYDLIHACDVSSSYNASQHFPSLGQRLLDLQEHVKSRNVGSVRGLWHDQRSMSQWWTFWVRFCGFEVEKTFLTGCRP